MKNKQVTVKKVKMMSVLDESLAKREFEERRAKSRKNWGQAKCDYGCGNLAASGSMLCKSCSFENNEGSYKSCCGAYRDKFGFYRHKEECKGNK